MTNFAIITEMQRRLIDFAEHALERMQNDEDWGCETWDSIAAKAKDLGLADYDSNQMFKRCFYRGRSDMHQQRLAHTLYIEVIHGKPEDDDNETSAFTFATQAELKAFQKRAHSRSPRRLS
jgi:hypothetical protein